MKFINFDDIVSKNENNYINKNAFTPQHPCICIIIGNSGCSKTNSLLNILTINPVYDSFGIGYIPIGIFKIYKNYKIITNIYRIQDISYNLCGMFCVLFILYDIKNKNDFIKFLPLFNANDFLKNELI